MKDTVKSACRNAGASCRRNGISEIDGHLCWNIEALVSHVKAGIEKAQAEYEIESLSIDTWGVDYVLMRGDKTVYPVYAYRDSRTEAVIPKVHEKLPFSELYRHTGIQFQPFNTIYQLFADKVAGRFDGVADFLMIPEYLMYRLCGAKPHEYTNATTTGMVNVKTGASDPDIIAALGLPKHLFHPLQAPGTCIGEYRGIKVKLCATHDTASAVEGIPMDAPTCHPASPCHPEERSDEGSQKNLGSPYISSGTWSLLGVKSPQPITDEASMQANWSNEGGVGYTRYQKNIMGMWIVNRLRNELCPEKPWQEITAEAEQSAFEETVDANAPAFLAPKSMVEAFDAALQTKPISVGDYFRCAYRSLALSYKNAIAELEQNTNMWYDKLYIVGGGAKNGFLNRLTEEATGKTVVALPIEATALGNIKIQMKR